MIVCQQNFYHVQKFQKQHYNKKIKPQSYVLNNKIWLNSKYVKKMELQIES